MINAGSEKGMETRLQTHSRFWNRDFIKNDTPQSIREREREGGQRDTEKEKERRRRIEETFAANEYANDTGRPTHGLEGVARYVSVFITLR